MASKCGIVGLPNIGKSTLFNLIVGKEQAEVADYPFCTIEPNISTILIKDPRLLQLSKLEKSAKIIYESMELYDIAGLVEGASKGEGLGNKFLGNILEVDVILHIVRLFQSDSMEDNYDPIQSFEVIMLEMMLWDLQRLETKINNSKKKNDEETLELIKIAEFLKKGEIYKSTKVNFPLICTKPMVLLGNGTTESLVKKMEEYCNAKKYSFFYFDFHQATEQDLQNIILKSYNTLDLINFFTCGPKEARAWTINKNYNYKKAAGAIHSDIENKFICANVVSFSEWSKIIPNDIMSLSDANLVEYQQKYKKLIPVMKKANEIVKDGDVIIFKHN